MESAINVICLLTLARKHDIIIAMWSTVDPECFVLILGFAVIGALFVVVMFIAERKGRSRLFWAAAFSLFPPSIFLLTALPPARQRQIKDSSVPDQASADPAAFDFNRLIKPDSTRQAKQA